MCVLRNVVVVHEEQRTGRLSIRAQVVPSASLALEEKCGFVRQ